MRIVKFIIALSVLLFPLMAHAATCQGSKGFTTALNVNLETPPPVLDLKRSLSDINEGQNEAHEEWLKKNGMQTIWKAENMETAGTTAGAWGSFVDFKMTATAADTYGLLVCPYFKQINLNLMYRSIISIPKEFPGGSCAYKVIMTHELKHHNTNVKIVQDAVARFRKDLPLLVTEIEKSGAASPRGQIDATIATIKQKISDAFKIYLEDTIAREMKKQNELIDSPEEYTKGTRLLDECKTIETSN